MNRIKSLALLLVYLSFSASLFAQTNKNAVMISDNEEITASEDEVISNFERNYDSLLHSFYIQQNSDVIESNFEKESDYMTTLTKAKDIPDSVFARRLERLPTAIKLDYNENVRKRIEYYIDRGGKRVSVMLGLSKYYFPLFEEILDQYSLPLELKYMVVIESALNPNAVSRAGATGLWQFMYATGRMYDLRINSLIDDRRDPIKATAAAAQYLTALYKIYNDWHLVLAAYNCGPGRVNRAIRRSGKRNYWEIYNFLPRETRGYIPNYIAAAYVMNYYEEHDIVPIPLSKPIATDTVIVHEDIHFNELSSLLNIPVEQIKDLNPQYKQNKILGTKGKYSLKLPLEQIQQYVALEDSISALSMIKSLGPNWRQIDYIYKETEYIHKVRKNESWTSIARKYGVKASELKRWNGNKKYPILGRNVKVYKTIRVEVPKEDKNKQDSPFNQESVVDNDGRESIDNSADTTKKTYTTVSHKVKKGETISSIAEKYGVSSSQLLEINGLGKRSILSIGQRIIIKSDVPVEKKEVAKKEEPKKEAVYHTIRRGDTVGAIAQRYGVSQRQIFRLNGITGKTILKLGRKLRVR